MKFRISELKLSCCLLAFFSSAFQAFGMYNVHAQSDLTEGGIFGLILLIEHWLHISPAISGFVLNAACYLLGWKTLGMTFVVYSLLAAAGFSGGYALCECFPPLFPGISQYPLAGAILGALFIGIGAGLCVRAGGATSGDDALAMSIHARTGMKVSTVYLISDLTILLLSLSYIPVKRIAYSLLTVVLSGQIIELIQKRNLK